MEAKLEQAPATNTNPALSIDKNGCVLYSNEAGYPLLVEWGVEVGEKLPSIIGTLVRKVISQNYPEKMEVKAGDSVFLVVFSPITELECVNISGFDISVQKELEKELQESEDKYKGIFNLIEDGISIGELVLDEEGHPIDVITLDLNPAFEKHSGIRREQILGRRITELFPFAEQIWLDRYMEVIHSGTGKHFEEYNASVDSWYSVFASPIRGNRFIAVFSDITERKQAEEALKKVNEKLEEKVKERTEELEEAYESLKESKKSLAEAQEMAHIGNWEWDIATDKAYWSEEMYRIFKRDPQKLAPSLKEYLSYIHPDDLDYYCKATDNTRKVSTSGFDFRIVLANGEERTLHLKSDFVFNDENIPIRTKGIVQDITERKKVEDALVKIETVRKQEIHHRIKNNLQVISSLLDLQAEKFKGKKNIKDSEVMEAFKESQDRVISMALIHEELHKGGEIDTLNFSHYSKELADNLFLTYRFGNESISLNTDIEEDIYFDMDTSVPLGIIINELVSNSLKHAFSGRDKGEIRIKLHREEGCNTTYILSVSDNGTGIPEDLEIKDLDSLGLQLVTTLVEQLDGELELKRNNGTEFIIRFGVTGNNDQELASGQLQLADNE